jgi:hypothetical protein
MHTHTHTLEKELRFSFFHVPFIARVTGDEDKKKAAAADEE